MSVLIDASVKAKSNQRKIEILFDFIIKLVDENDLDTDGEILAGIISKIEKAGDTTFYESEYAQQFPEYVAASDAKNEGLIDGLLDHLSGGDDDDNKDD